MRAADTVTLIIPSLNEEKNIAHVLTAVIRAQSDDALRNFRLVVADNGSVDSTKEICRTLGVEVLEIAERGYGACLSAAINKVESDWIAFLDADGTYDPMFLLPLFTAAQATSADMVIGSRFAGTIEARAMPHAHRYVGTPVLNFLIRVLFRVKISDCNSGMRLIRRNSFLRWNVNAAGMEFATATIAKAAVHNSRMTEVPISFLKSPASRQPHLQPLRDGLRNVFSLLRIRFCEKLAN